MTIQTAGGRATVRGGVDWIQAHERVEAANAPRRRSARSWLLLLAVLVVAAGAYVEAHQRATGRVPLETVVAGIDIGGLTDSAAAARLEQKLGPALNVPVRVTHGDSGFTIVPADAGVRLDAKATVRAARVASSWSPGELVRYYSGGRAISPSVTIEPTAFHHAMQALTAEIGKPAVDGTLGFGGGVAQAVYGQPGLALDDAVAQRVLTELAFTHRTSELPLTQHAPTVSNAAVDHALQSFGQPAMAGPVTVMVAGNQVAMPPAAFGGAITMTAADGSLTPVVDPAKLEAALRAFLPGTGPQMQNAGVSIVGTTATVTPAVSGISFDQAALAAAFTQVLSTPGAARVVDAHATLTQPQIPTASAQSWGITAPVGTATFAADPADGAKINGFVIEPGQSMTLSAVLGTTDPGLAAGLAAAAQNARLPATLQGADVVLAAPVHGVLIQVTQLGAKELTVTLWSSR